MIDLKIKEKESCMGCHACSSVCPQGCISMDSDSEGFWYPKVDRGKCIKCELCIKTCPIINKIAVENKPVAYACINKNEEIRLESSSGGIFTLVAEEVINNGGIVFGVGFDKDFNVIHSYVKNKEKLAMFRGSKYVQSRIGDTYSQAKFFLEEGKQVLFTGTPCQISGLKSYLRKDYDNLFCVDNICHGVPSPKVWKKYVYYHEDRVGSPTKRIAFRRKDKGWKQYSVSFRFENGTEYCETLKEDLYMRAFLKDVCLRPSCYACEFKTLSRESDITLADFWGIQKMLPDMDDDKGTSLIFVNSDSGQSMFENIEEKIIYKEVDINQAVSYNSAAIKSVEYNPKRDDFFEDLGMLDFDGLVRKYCTNKLLIRLRRKIKSVVCRILKK